MQYYTTFQNELPSFLTKILEKHWKDFQEMSKNICLSNFSSEELLW